MPCPSESEQLLLYCCPACVLSVFDGNIDTYLPKERCIVNHFHAVEQAHGVQELRHKTNDLRVLLIPNDLGPVAGIQVTYHVGSRNEGAGHTGATHILEHLMFKGSKNFNRKKGNNIDQLENVGAYLNATTWLDRTNYFEVLPEKYLSQAIAIEACRMRNAFLDEEDRQAEMTVVRNEFERDENAPVSALHKNIWSTAYQAHPYHHNTIGWLSDIENVSIDRLKEFYDTFYWPNNATVTVIGSFDQEEVLGLIHQHFGAIKKSDHPIPEVYTTEPKQDGPRRLIVKRVGQPGVVGIAFKTPKGLSLDHLKIQLVSKVLTAGKSSRLYKRLVSTGLASAIFAEDYPNLDEGLFVVYAMLTPGTDHDAVEAILLEELESMKTTVVGVKELEKVKAMMLSDQIYDRGSYFSTLSQINEALAIGDWKYFLTMEDQMKGIKPKDLQEAAQGYLFENNSTTGYFVPQTVEA